LAHAVDIPVTVVDLRIRRREDIHLVKGSGCDTLGADNIIRPRFAHERKVGWRQWAGDPVHAPIGTWVDGILASGVPGSALVAARARHLAVTAYLHIPKEGLAQPDGGVVVLYKVAQISR